MTVNAAANCDPVAGTVVADGDTTYFHQLIAAASMSQVVAVAAELGIADVIADTPVDATTLAQAINCDPGALQRLLHALVGAGLLECNDGRYALTSRGCRLQRDARPGMRETLRWWGRYRWQAWGRLLDGVRTGQSTRQATLGSIGFEGFESDSCAATIFNGAMSELSRELADALLASRALDRAKSVVDVGGGNGAMLATLLTARLDLRGVLFDLPHAIDAARARLADTRLADRCELVCGSFFDQMPAGGDTYVLARILHDWDEPDCIRILANCRRAMGEDAQLVVIDRLMPRGFAASELHAALAISDLNMLVMLGGRERNLGEVERLLGESGFTLRTAAALTSEFHLIVARPA